MKVIKIKTDLTHLASHKCGAHDPRPRRQRTRQAKNKQWKKENGVK